MLTHGALACNSIDVKLSARNPPNDSLKLASTLLALKMKSP